MTRSAISINNTFFKEQKISPQQLFLYSHLYRYSITYNGKQMTRTSIVNILETMQCKVNGERISVKKRNILSDLIHMVNLNILYCEEPVQKVNKNYSFQFNNEEVISSYFTNIPYNVFDRFYDKNKYWIYCFVSSKGSQGLKMSFNDLSQKSGLSISLLKDKIITELENSIETPKIYKYSGSRIQGNHKQEENRYISDMFLIDGGKKSLNE